MVMPWLDPEPCMLELQDDRREALVTAEQRRMALERANKMLYDETDDIKALHGKLLLSEVGPYAECSWPFLVCDHVWPWQHTSSNTSTLYLAV